MCGIVVARDRWLRLQPGEPAANMAAAVARLRWRGPDGSGVVRLGDWWLGCARLAITQPASRQPVVTRSGRWAAVLNGAITNARELWAHFLPGVERRAAPPNDAWLPLLAVARDDLAALAALRGHHAYAVVDLAGDRLVLGQDRFGEKPLFCLRTANGDGGGLLAAASTLPALAAVGGPAPNRLTVRAGYWHHGFAAPTPARLAAGMRLVELPRRGLPCISTAGGRPVPHPGPPPTPPLPDGRSRWRPGPPAGSLRERLVASVARCLDASPPAGLLLSGGIDSSVLAAAAHELGKSLPCFQFRANGSDETERRLARAVAQHCHLAFHPVDAGPEVLDALPDLIAAVGWPLGDPSVLAMHATCRAAAAAGCRILLSGEGADELFLGYRRYRALAHLPRLPRGCRLPSDWSMTYLARWLRAATSPQPAASLLEVTPPEFRRQVLATTSPPRWRHPGGDPVLQARAADLTGYLRLDLLPKVDVASLSAGIEARCPYLEGDLADTPVSRADVGKRQLREAFANSLPIQVFRQPKRGFSLPLDRWFRAPTALLDLLAEPRSRQRAHLRPGGLATAIDRHRSGRANLGHSLYLLAAMEFFLRRHDAVDSPTRTDQSGPPRVE